MYWIRKSKLTGSFRIIKICVKHGLYPSIKAGGYGTAGHSICGDIVLDLRKIDGVEIEPPQFSGGFISLKDMLPPSSKGKGKIEPESIPATPGVLAGSISTPLEPLRISGTPQASGPLKRTRSPTSQYPYDYGLPRNETISALLHHDEMEMLPPNSRRRFDRELDVAPVGDAMSRQSSSGSDNSKASASTPDTSLSVHSDDASVDLPKSNPTVTGNGTLGIFVTISTLNIILQP